MALNKLMHKRNPYRDRKPNFKDLAEKYEDFRQHATKSDNGTYHIDFKKPECLRALTWALLKDDFGLDVLMPLDRLIPTVPLRLNYILWLEDVLAASLASGQSCIMSDGGPEADDALSGRIVSCGQESLRNKLYDISGIDIGSGASCVYGLLGAKKNSWRFLVTEADATNYEYAKKNVMNNNLDDKIKIMKVEESAILYDVLSSSTDRYDFCMCNPPFYGSNFEAWGMLTSRSDDRPEPNSVSTASPAESIVPGGEVEFVKRMIADSLLLGERVRIYTTMFGKKSSLSVIKQELLRNNITNIGQTEFCQGKTMRWGIGWSFDKSVIFPKPPSKIARQQKPKPPLVYQIPQKGEMLKDVEYTLDDIADKVEGFLSELQVLHQCSQHTPNQKTYDVMAHKNTWSHQRRKRRKLKQKDQTGGEAGNGEVIEGESANAGTKLEMTEAKVSEVDVPQEKYAVQSTVIQTQVTNSAALSVSKTVMVDSPHETVSIESIQDKASATSLNKTPTGDNLGDVIDTEAATEKDISYTTISHPQTKTPVKDGGQQEMQDTPENKVSDTDTSNQKRGCEDVEGVREDSGEEDPLFTASLSVKEVGYRNLHLEMSWQGGRDREAMNQVLQYIKNRLH